jgi:hypothetical protein
MKRGVARALALIALHVLDCELDDSLPRTSRWGAERELWTIQRGSAAATLAGVANSLPLRQHSSEESTEAAKGSSNARAMRLSCCERIRDRFFLAEGFSLESRPGPGLHSADGKPSLARRRRVSSPRAPASLSELSEGDGDSKGGRKDGSELERARRTKAGAFTTEARFAYSSVLFESSKWVRPGCTLAIIDTKQLEVSELFNSRVSFESR